MCIRDRLVAVAGKESLGLVEFGERPGSVALAVPTFDMLDVYKRQQGEYLDNIALRSGLTRKGAGKAITTLRFTLSVTIKL